MDANVFCHFLSIQEVNVSVLVTMVSLLRFIPCMQVTTAAGLGSVGLGDYEDYGSLYFNRLSLHSLLGMGI